MTGLPDYLQPAADPDGSYEALLEKAQRVEAMGQTEGWQDFRDWILSRAHNLEKRVIAGDLTHEQYLHLTGMIAACMTAADAPKLMRQMAENRRPPAAQEA